MPEKIIRDPVHDVIAFRLDRPIDALLFQLVNAAELQRLRRIRQLGMASLAYPGADHSRYSHSLGVMETARQVLDHVSQSTPIDIEDRTVCLAAALLHDLGHGPLSHAFERVSGISHEKLTTRLIADPDTQVHRTLAAHDKQLPGKVCDLLRGQPRRRFFHDLIAGPLDTDRLDYLLRDNLMTGSRYGAYDLGWLLHALIVHAPSDRLAVAAKGVSAVEAYVQARFHMYRNVYFHKVVRSAEGMMRLLLRRARRLAIQDRLPWPPRDSAVFKSLIGQRLSVKEFVDLDDVSILHCFKVWSGADDRPLMQLCRGLLERRVYKTIDMGSFAIEDHPMLVEAAHDAVTRAGGDTHYDMFYEQVRERSGDHYEEADETDGESPSPAAPAEPEEIMVQQPDGSLAPMSKVSPTIAALAQSLRFQRIHVAAEYRDVVMAAIAR